LSISLRFPAQVRGGEEEKTEQITRKIQTTTSESVNVLLLFAGVDTLTTENASWKDMMFNSAALPALRHAWLQVDIVGRTSLPSLIMQLLH
jgi:hypothetical protein